MANCIFPAIFISSNILIFFQVDIFGRATCMKGSDETGNVLELHLTFPHFLNPFWPSEHVNMKKSVQFNFIS